MIWMAKADLSFIGTSDKAKELRRAVLSGKKSATLRLGKHGKVGDYFFVNKTKFRITKRLHITLKNAFGAYFKIEGFKSSEDFRKAWVSFNPERNKLPMVTKAYIYFFKKVG